MEKVYRTLTTRYCLVIVNLLCDVLKKIIATRSILAAGKVLRQRWKEYPYELGFLTNTYYTHCVLFSCRSVEDFYFWGGDSFCHDPTIVEPSYRGKTWRPEDIKPGSSSNAKSDEIARDVTLTLASSRSRRGPRRQHSAQGTTTRFDCLLVELKKLVFDNLSDSDTGAAIEALNWYLPDRYWISRLSRLPLDIIFEVDGISPDGMDWQHLFAKFQDLRQTSRGFRNRQRIFTILKGTREVFNTLVEKDNS
ncbi:hypothetical protein FQN57_004523 [Myotisia sp. PD_48]|nr:hypothetical protein FQN57_004523 [Myotisia sp. PD_48]